MQTSTRYVLKIYQFWLLQQQPPEVFCKKKVISKNFAIFTEKHLCWSLFLIKLQALLEGLIKLHALLRRESNTVVCFSVNISKLLTTVYFIEQLRWLLLLLQLEKTKDPFTPTFSHFYVFACSTNKYFEFIWHFFVSIIQIILQKKFKVKFTLLFTRNQK